MTDNPALSKPGHAKFLGRFKRLWFHNSLADRNSSFSCGARTRIFIYLSAIAAVFLLLLASFLIPHDFHPALVRSLQVILISTGVAALGLVVYFFQRDFLLPLMHLRHWVHLMRGGFLHAQIPVVKDAEFADLAEDLNMIGIMLLKLSEDAENQLQEHTKHITSKTRSLQILYDLSASINYSGNMDDLLSKFLQTICNVANAEAATVRLFEDNHFRLVKSYGLEKFHKLDEHLLLVHEYPRGEAILNGKVVWDEAVDWDLTDMPGNNQRQHVGIVSVPLAYRNRILGLFNLFIDMRNLGNRKEMKTLLLSIGQHCGMAIEKTRLDAEAHRLNIMEEREHLSHELHDSLAQTLVSLRFQIRVLDETVESDDKQSLWQQLERIENTIDEANTELRELITHFRAPIDKRGVMVALKQIVRRFQEETEISIFLQQEWPEVTLPGNMEIQVLRIIQETLANIRKHSEAHTVRILLRSDHEGEFTVLVEDDGVGFDKPATSNHPGEHIGLGIMRERAQKIGGELIVDSEPGEGTRVVLKFSYPQKKISCTNIQTLAGK
ncbi:MAG: GAF domain-containing protein [Gammaproteobacteria bacterium]|nr:GAF domain-containing protein [Gammaproteobacteria bacterium]